MTWTSHSLANGALVLAATGRLDLTLAAIVTATLPDQIERFIPWKRHRGGSHWLVLWILILIAVPVRLPPTMARSWPFSFHGLLKWHGTHVMAGAIVFGMALGPLLHVFLDACSSAGVPVLPFSRARLKLSLYRTGSARTGKWTGSELTFLACLLGVCAFVWQSRWHLR